MLEPLYEVPYRISLESLVSKLNDIEQTLQDEPERIYDFCKALGREFNRTAFEIQDSLKETGENQDYINEFHPSKWYVSPEGFYNVANSFISDLYATDLETEQKSQDKLDEELVLIEKSPIFYGVLRSYIPAIAEAIFPKTVAEKIKGFYLSENRLILRFD